MIVRTSCHRKMGEQGNGTEQRKRERNRPGDERRWSDEGKVEGKTVGCHWVILEGEERESAEACLAL